MVNPTVNEAKSYHHPHPQGIWHRLHTFLLLMEKSEIFFLFERKGRERYGSTWICFKRTSIFCCCFLKDSSRYGRDGFCGWSISKASSFGVRLVESRGKQRILIRKNLLESRKIPKSKCVWKNPTNLKISRKIWNDKNTVQDLESKKSESTVSLLDHQVFGQLLTVRMRRADDSSICVYKFLEAARIFLLISVGSECPVCESSFLFWTTPFDMTSWIPEKELSSHDIRSIVVMPDHDRVSLKAPDQSSQRFGDCFIGCIVVYNQRESINRSICRVDRGK